MLPRLGKPVTLAVNKADTVARDDLAHEFYELGIRDVFPVSAEHGTGVSGMLDHVTAGSRGTAGRGSRPGDQSGDHRAAERREIDAAQRPDGEERAIVSPVAGTTRDAVDAQSAAWRAEYVFVDTAGIRRKGKTKEMAEKLSVVMARRHIRMAQVVLVVLDASEGVVALDATIAGYAHEGGRA